MIIIKIYSNINNIQYFNKNIKIQLSTQMHNKIKTKDKLLIFFYDLIPISNYYYIKYTESNVLDTDIVDQIAHTNPTKYPNYELFNE